MNTPTIHHTLTVITQLCKGCTHCMKRCPTGAIRIHGGKANIDAKLCIDCGQCMVVCANKAIKVEQDSLSQLARHTYNAAIIPASFFVQFSEDTSLSDVLWALYEIGFSHLYLAETGIDILSVLPIEDQKTNLPVISNFCPAVQRLIQIKYPLLVGNLSIIRPPAQIVAIFAKLELQNHAKQLGIFYITACAAKISQFKTEGSEEHNLFTGIINFDTLYNRVCSLLSKSTEPHQGYTFSFNSYTQRALLWSLVKGQSANHIGRTLAVDEMHNVIEFLEILEDEEETTLEFLELDACAEGCVGGVLTVRNRFLASEQLRHWAANAATELDQQGRLKILNHKKSLMQQLYLEPVEPLSVLSLDEDHSKALQKLQKVESILSILPGIDCALCGSPSCRSLAEDIAKGQASIRQCAVLKLRNAKELTTLAKIWGERPTAADE